MKLHTIPLLLRLFFLFLLLFPSKQSAHIACVLLCSAPIFLTNGGGLASTVPLPCFRSGPLPTLPST
jgi:hypothetical protein